MPKIYSLEKLLARARLDAKRAVNPVKQSKAKALTDNPDWQAQYLAEFNRFYTDKISTQNDTERKNDSIKKQILTARNAKAAAVHGAKKGYIISDVDIKNEAQKYGEDAGIYIQNYQDEYQRIWDETTPKEQIQVKAKTNGARLAREGSSIDENKLAQSAEQYDQFAELYIQTYKDAYHAIFDNMTPEQKVKAKAKSKGIQLARQTCSIDEERLVQTAAQYGELAELYIQAYKDAHHPIFDKMTPEQKVKAKAKTIGAHAARQSHSISEERLEKSAEQYDELAGLYIQTYKDAYHPIFDNMTPEQKVIAKAKKNGAQLAYIGHDSINEKQLATKATQFGELSELYAENYKNSHKGRVNKKRPLPENAKKHPHSKRARLP